MTYNVPAEVGRHADPVSFILPVGLEADQARGLTGRWATQNMANTAYLSYGHTLPLP